jgi:RNA polymerase sigma-70 factor, ECF subfamily
MNSTSTAISLELLEDSLLTEQPADANLFIHLYDDLRQLARHMLSGERVGHSVQATALVHEAYLRLAKSKALTPKDRKHFLALAGRVMRRLLVDRIRRKRSIKRGAEDSIEDHADVEIATTATSESILDIDRALVKLEALSPRTARIVEWHYIVGFSIDEIASILEVSRRTVLRDLKMAKCFLSDALPLEIKD